MKVVIFIEENVYPLDFAIPYELFSQAGADVRLVASEPGQLTTATGLNIEVKHGLMPPDTIDLLWVCADIDGNGAATKTLSWLDMMARYAKFSVAVCRAVDYLIEAGVTLNMPLSVNRAAHKKYKGLPLTPSYQTVVKGDSLLTVNSHSAVLQATLLAIEQLFDAAVADDIKNKYDIAGFEAWDEDERAARKFSKLDDKAVSRYLKDMKKPIADNNCVLYAYRGMAAIDYLVADAYASHMGYQIKRIADRRGAIKPAQADYDIVADDAIQNHKQAKLLVVPGGEIDQHVVNQFLVHWFVGICTASYRVMTVGSAEQLLGVTGLLKEIDPDVLANLALGEGKYLLVANFAEVARALQNIDCAENEKRALLTARHFGFSAKWRDLT